MHEGKSPSPDRLPLFPFVNNKPPCKLSAGVKRLQVGPSGPAACGRSKDSVGHKGPENNLHQDKLHIYERETPLITAEPPPKICPPPATAPNGVGGSKVLQYFPGLSDPLDPGAQIPHKQCEWTAWPGWGTVTEHILQGWLWGERW